METTTEGLEEWDDFDDYEDCEDYEDCKDYERQAKSFVDAACQTSRPLTGRCHPNIKITFPSKQQLKYLMNQSRGRPDRFGCLLFRSVLPKQRYAEWMSITNWDGSRGKLALPINLRHYIIKAVLEKFPSLTSGDRKRVRDRINEFLRSPRIGVGHGDLHSNPEGVITDEEETATDAMETITEELITEQDFEEMEKKEKTAVVKPPRQTPTAPVLRCHPHLKFSSPSTVQLRILLNQSLGRSDRYGCLLFRSVVPKQLYAEWAATTNWDGSRGKLGLPVNLKHFIIKTVSEKFPNLTPGDRKRIKDRVNEYLRSPRTGVRGGPLHSNPEGRKRSGTDTSSGVWLSTSSSKLNQVYGVAAWTSWVKTKKGQTPDKEEQQSPSHMTVKEDVLQCSSAELSYSLCRFIKEVRRPNGEVYEPDSIYYLCLGIQQCLLENGRLENIFTDSLYSEFTSEITTLLKDWSNSLPPGGYINSRVEEEYLWECKQLGALSPIVLLNTLLFFGAKMLNLKTVEQHQRLTFANVTQCSKTTKNDVTSYLKFKLPNKGEATDKRAAVKRKREEETVDEQFMEMPENSENPLRCPVRLYQFYLSKCSDSVKQRPDLFYLQPESSCHPSSPVWYSAQPLDTSMMESMLIRIVVVRDIHLDCTQKYPDSSDEESS